MSSPEEMAPARAKLMKIYRFLQELNDLRNPVQREIADQPWALWLHDLPRHSDVQLAATLNDPNSGEDADGVVLRVRRPELSAAPPPPAELLPWLEDGWSSPYGEVTVRRTLRAPQAEDEPEDASFDDDPRRISALKLWREERSEWVQQELPARETSKLYDRLYTLQARMERESERVELVLGDGLLFWRDGNGTRTHHPVLLQRVQLSFDPSVPEFTIAETEHPPELFTALLRPLPDITSAALRRAQDDLEHNAYHPLGGDGTTTFFSNLIQGARGEFTSPEHLMAAGESARLTRDPVLFLRPRTLGYATVLESILIDLQTCAELPDAVLNIAGITPLHDGGDGAPPIGESPNGEDEAVLLSKHANAEQLEIARRLDRYGAVLVQGPPGTGKTHTIGNLIGHLLAQGKTVLVTSHTSKALRVVRGQVVDALKPLCVSVLDNDMESRKQLEDSVDEIQNRLSAFPAGAASVATADPYEPRRKVLRELLTARERLLRARYDEYRSVVVAGEQYAPKAAARLVAERRSPDGWIPGEVEHGAPCPLAAAEVFDLYRTNGELTASDEAELVLSLPAPTDLQPPAEFTRLVQARTQLMTLDQNHRKDLWLALEGDANRLRSVAERCQAALARIEGSLEWQLEIMHAGKLGGSHRKVWDDLLALISQVYEQAAESQAARLRLDPFLPEEYRTDRTA